MDSPTRSGPATCLAAGALLLAGCANIHNDRTRTKVEGTTAGVGAGAVIGGVIGGVVSMGSPTSIAQGAIIGAQIGGQSGYAYATSVANKKAAYATHEAWLDACIAEARTNTQKSADYNERARRIIAWQEARIPQVLQDGKIRPEDEARAAELREQLDTSITNLHGAIQSWDNLVQSHRTVIKNYGNLPEGETLREQVDILSRQQDDLRQDMDGMTALRKELSP